MDEYWGKGIDQGVSPEAGKGITWRSVMIWSQADHVTGHHYDVVLDQIKIHDI